MVVSSLFWYNGSFQNSFARFRGQFMKRWYAIIWAFGCRNRAWVAPCFINNWVSNWRGEVSQLVRDISRNSQQGGVGYWFKVGTSISTVWNIRVFFGLIPPFPTLNNIRRVWCAEEPNELHKIAAVLAHDENFALHSSHSWPAFPNLSHLGSGTHTITVRNPPNLCTLLPSLQSW